MSDSIHVGSIEIRTNDGQLDEVVAVNCTVHLEQMDANRWWMEIRTIDGDVHVNLWAARAVVHGSWRSEPL